MSTPLELTERVAEFTGGSQMEMKTDRMPHRFRRALWSPLVGDAPVAG